MGTAETIDKEINHYLVRLNPRQKETVLNVVKTFAEDDEFDAWNDEDFLFEMDRRINEYESGKLKTLTLEDLENGARKSFRIKSEKIGHTPYEQASEQKIPKISQGILALDGL